jgi:hypothetical protein
VRQKPRILGSGTRVFPWILQIPHVGGLRYLIMTSTSQLGYPDTFPLIVEKSMAKDIVFFFKDLHRHQIQPLSCTHNCTIYLKIAANLWILCPDFALVIYPLSDFARFSNVLVLFFKLQRYIPISTLPGLRQWLTRHKSNLKLSKLALFSSLWQIFELWKCFDKDTDRYEISSNQSSTRL